MAAIDYGVAHWYGLYGTLVYMTIQSDGETYTKALDVEVADENGVVITDHLDDTRMELSLEGVIKDSATLPEIGTQMTYNGTQYIMKNIDDKGTNKDFRRLSIKAIKYQEIA